MYGTVRTVVWEDGGGNPASYPMREENSSPVGTVEHRAGKRSFMAHSYSSCLIHYVFSTKERRKSISSEMRERLWAYIGGIASDHGMRATVVGGTDDHVHALISLPATLSVAKAIQLIKGGSSKWIHDTFPTHGDFAWQEGYGAFGIGVSGLTSTIAYIKAQEEHHKTRSFEEEFLAFLDRHDMEYDARYVLG